MSGPIPVFPTLPRGFPAKWSPVFKTTVGQAASGRETRKNNQSLSLWQFEILFEVLRDQTQNDIPYGPLAGFTDYMQLCQIWLSMYGRFGLFYFDAPWDNSRSNQPIGTGDGTTVAFVAYRTFGVVGAEITEFVGGLNVVSAVYLNGVLQSPTTYYASGNVIVFNSPPSTGVSITATFTFYYLCAFLEDNQSFEEFFKNYWRVPNLKFRSVSQLASTVSALPPSGHIYGKTVVSAVGSGAPPVCGQAPPDSWNTTYNTSGAVSISGPYASWNSAGESGVLGLVCQTSGKWIFGLRQRDDPTVDYNSRFGLTGSANPYSTLLGDNNPSVGFGIVALETGSQPKWKANGVTIALNVPSSWTLSAGLNPGVAMPRNSLYLFAVDLANQLAWCSFPTWDGTGTWYGNGGPGNPTAGLSGNGFSFAGISASTLFLALDGSFSSPSRSNTFVMYPCPTATYGTIPPTGYSSWACPPPVY